MTSSISSSDLSPRIFRVSKSQVIGRWDPFYYRPELVELEKLVLKVTSHRLRDFALTISGGATPSTTEYDKHYTDVADGIPFIRVQNLSTTGILDLSDCKRITRSTHEGLLRRSRLFGGELLVKITGVGRMAIASVVPIHFEANINQHIVAVRTQGIETSKLLAAYLNLDIAERLASRRATGGTRPALDYPALLSLPVIVDPKIAELSAAANRQYKDRIAASEMLLREADESLLRVLGITRLPDSENTVTDRIFRTRFSQVSGGRLDPSAHQAMRQALVEAVHSSRFPVSPLRELVRLEKRVVRSIPPGETYVGLENIDGATGEFSCDTEKTDVGTATRFRKGQILYPKLRPYLNKTYLAEFDGVCSTEFHVFSAHRARADYLYWFLRSDLLVRLASLLMTGNTLPRLQLADIEHFPIPVPPPDKQRELCEQLAEKKRGAAALRSLAEDELRRARRGIESLILGVEEEEG